ncbi:MAG: TRAP transporter substrate-binding protein DctP [Caldimonas sp.]
MNMKLRSSALILAGTLAFAGLPAICAAATVIRMNHQMAASTAGSIVDQWFADEVKKRTNGEVEIKIFFSNGLGAAKETLSLLENGAIDMAGLSPGYFPDQLPFFTAPNSIPMAIDNIDQAYRLSERLMKEVPAMTEEARSKGIRPLFFHVLNPYVLVAKEPILSVAQMNGKKFRTWGSDLPRMAQAVGAVPVTLGVTELYEGLLRGVVDAIPFSVDLMENYKIYEVAKHVMDITIWDGPTWAVWMTDKAWAKLTPGQQKIVMEVADEAGKKDLEMVRKAATDADKSLRARGVAFHKFPDAEKAKWKAKLPSYFDEFVAAQTAKGKGDDAKKMVKIWNEVVSTK